MGGCKCSYRNCTSKTNGQTHLFHYPVFDRPRCNKWLINAQRQEFFNLKVSQLKNRVVCQYHFKDDDFMNSNKEKLKATAIPTLNGPFCDPSEWGGGEAEEMMNQIDLDDIENDLFLNYEKKDCISRKYGNFLADSDFGDLEFLTYKKPSVTNFNVKKPTKTNVSYVKPTILNFNHNKPSISEKESFVSNVKTPVTPYRNENTGKRQLNLEDLMRTPSKSQNRNSYSAPKTIRISKIEIISDEKVNDVLKGVTKLEPVKHDTLLPLPKRLRNTRQNTREKENSSVPLIKEEVSTNETTFSSDTKDIIQNVENDNLLPMIEIQQPYEIPVITPSDLPVLDLGQTALNVNQLQMFEPPKLSEIQDTGSKKILDNNLQNLDQQQILNRNKIGLGGNKNSVKKSIVKTPEKALVSVLKNKMCSKRLSAIQKKRDFNKKLTDVISSQILNEKEKQLNIDKISVPKDIQAASSAEITNSKNNTYQKQVKSHLSEDSSLLTTNEYSIAALEMRMKKMERMLLQKMEENTRVVQNLKKSLDNRPSGFRSVTTQTGIDEESHKKYLYHEISKYLSPAANSFIFEELFINKFEPKRKLRR